MSRRRLKFSDGRPTPSAFLYAASERRSHRRRFSLHPDDRNDARSSRSHRRRSPMRATALSSRWVTAGFRGSASHGILTAPAKAEIALLNPRTAVVTINSLGFHTPPALFAQSSMVFTTASDSAAIDTFVPQRDGLLRELIDYSYPARSAFVLASGTARGPLSMSWSPDGRSLAIVDGDASFAMLTVMIPPR